MRISAAVLAGGAGTRMGGILKSSVPVGGKPILKRMYEIISGVFDETMIIAGTPDEFPYIPSHLIIPDILKDKGPLGGIHAALRSTASDAVFIFAGDMPLISGDLIKRQMEKFKYSGSTILVPRTGKLIEPLHSIYRVSIVATLEHYISESRKLAIWDFYNFVEPDYFDLGDSEEIRNSFLNVNFHEDILAAEKILEQREMEQRRSD